MSVAVALTVSVKSASLLAGGVMVEAGQLRGGQAHTPPPWSVPADSDAPVGTPLIGDREASDPSVSARVEVDRQRDRRSSLPLAGAAASVGVSAHRVDRHGDRAAGAGLHAAGVGRGRAHRQGEVGCRCWPGGVRVRPLSWPTVRAQMPPPWSVPWLSAAPAGTPAMVTLRTSDGSVSAAVIDSAIGRSSLPLAGETDRVGASATASTVTARLWLVLALPAPSVEVAVTVSVKAASLLAGGVRVRPATCAGVSVQTPPP